MTAAAVPLYLVPRTIAEEIRTKRRAVYRILVERSCRHNYTVRVETADEHRKNSRRKGTRGGPGR